MNIIEIEENDLKKFNILSNSSHESIVYLNDNIVYKIFIRAEDNLKYKANYNKNDLEQKKNKILLLNDIPLDERFIKPTNLIYINDNFRGYTMNYVSDTTLNDCIFKKKNIKISLLKEAREIIKEAHKNNIILGDLNNNNFLLKNYLTLCDLDNCCIGNYKNDSLNHNLTKDYLKFNSFNENIDWFLFNVICISIITKRAEQFVLNPHNLENTIIFKNKELYKFYKDLVSYKITDYSNDVINILENKKKIFKL